MNYHSIRVRTSDPAALLRFLDSFQSSVHVSGPGLGRTDIHSDPPSDERLANAILRTGLGGAPRDYLATAVGEATTSVRVVAYGIAVLLAILVAFGVHAVQARAFADRVAAVGILRAVGASNGWMRRRLFLETMPFSLLAGAVGALIGFFVGKFLQPEVDLVVFGHQVPIVFDFVTLALIVVLLVAVSIGSAFVLLRGTLRLRPTESIRETIAVEPLQSLEAILRG
jgi:ABC-type antimicrobial peptide transport system permease subunit